MLRFLCCCCCFSSSGQNSNNETQPLLQPSTVSGSARQTRPAHTDAWTVKRIGRLVMRRVCVQELDQRFSDMAETFNEQQKRYEAMVKHIRNLQRSWDCSHNDALTFSECIGKIIKDYESKYRISLKMKGYDFSLSVVQSENVEEPFPSRLRLAQNEVKMISENARATISKGTTLQELIGWLIRSQDQMAEQVKGAAETYQEQGRLNENLEENMREVKRAKELAQEYRKQAGEVLTEAAHIAGAHI